MVIIFFFNTFQLYSLGGPRSIEQRTLTIIYLKSLTEWKTNLDHLPQKSVSIQLHCVAYYHLNWGRGVGGVVLWAGLFIWKFEILKIAI